MKFMKFKVFTLALCAFIFVGKHTKAQNNFFAAINESSCVDATHKRVIIPKKYKTFKLDLTAIKNFLATVPNENVVTNMENAPILELPMPDGTTAKFHVWESKMMEEGLAMQVPDIKTYAGKGITDKYATMRFDITEFGFSAIILSSVTGSIFIDPYDQQTTTNYISYYKKDFHKEGFIEYTPIPAPKRTTAARAFPAGQCIGAERRSYRLAVGCSNQYAKAATGLANPTKAQALAKIVTSVNRVNAVYEMELGIHFNLVANNINIVYVTTSGDPFSSSNSNANNLITASQNTITSVIGSANFDIGHTFSTGGGGLAQLGVVCQDAYKASGITGSPSPVGDPYDIDYVAHEIGHQCGGDHTFNANTSSCSGNANNTPASTATNCEPGSGSTIMAYAGICGTTNDLQSNSDPQFHAVSIAEILDYMVLDLGNNCAMITNTGNTPPTVTAGTNYTIPINTPFMLTGSATDADNDALTYSWEQIDVNGTLGNWNQTQVVKIPLFRSFVPDTSSTRYFPKLDDVVNGTTTIGERLPSITRTMAFRLTVRDNHATGGGTCFADRTISVSSTGGAFSVSYPNASGITWLNGESRTVTWVKGSTDVAPFNVANVAIELSVDGGYTFPYTILSSTPNDGSESIVVPAQFTSSARIRVKALNNVFYDISNADFTIAVNPVPVKWISFTAAKEKNNDVKIDWSVNEIGVSYYVVERSVNGDNYTTLAKVDANIVSSINTYSFIDTKTTAGKLFYRIKQVDRDGHYSYSSVAIVIIADGKNNFVVYPNPAKSKVNIFCNSNSTKLNIQLFDAVGKLVLSTVKTNATKGSTINLDLQNISKGIYNLCINNSGEIETQKLIVE